MFTLLEIVENEFNAENRDKFRVIAEIGLFKNFPRNRKYINLPKFKYFGCHREIIHRSST